MSTSLTRSRRRLRPASTALAALLAAAFVAAPAHASQVEQITRADGVAGASPIESHSSQPTIISEDGATSYFSFQQEWGAWATASGLWRRDLATNKTSQIVGAGATATGLSSDGKLLGIRTDKRLVTADTNKVDDLYSYDTVTRKIALVSRWDGPAAAATGLKGPGFIVADGKTALYSTSAGIARRDLATGKTVKVGDGALGDYRQNSASADGSVFFAGADKLVSPRGTENIGTPDTYASSVAVSPDGRYAVVQAVRSSDGAPVGFVVDTTTGGRTPYDASANGTNSLLVGFSADNRALVARGTGDFSFEVLAITLPGGASTRVATFAAPIWTMWSVSANAKFATATTNGVSWGLSADGVNLPGGADLPSPGAYFTIYPGCRASGWPFNLPAVPSTLGIANPSAIFPMPKVSQLLIRVTSAAGAVLQSATYNAGADWPNVKLPAGGGFKLSATVKYADGRSNAETWTVPSPKDACSITL